MKGIFCLAVFTLFFLGIGCQTVPRHLVREEVVIIYYEPIPVDPDPVYIIPLPEPPHLIGTNPPTSPHRDGQPNKPNDGGSYGKRDPLRGNDKIKSGEIKTYPPVRNQEKNDRAQ